MECELVIRSRFSLWQHAAFLDFAAHENLHQDKD